MSPGCQENDSLLTEGMAPHKLKTGVALEAP